MAEEQKNQQQIAPQQGQNQQQLQTLLKETLKENKSLQGKNIKLQNRYVQLFKQHKLLKKDHTNFVAFLSKLFNGNSNTEGSKPSFMQLVIGQYEISQLQKLASQKQSAFKNRIEQLQMLLEQRQKVAKSQLERTVKEIRQQITKDYEQKIKGLIKSHDEKVKELTSSYQQKIKELTKGSEEKIKNLTKGYEDKLQNYKQTSTKQSSFYFKQLQNLKKTNKLQSQQITQIKNNLQTKNSELSKISKQKLKLQHHLNNIRKKQFAQELTPDKQKEKEKLMNERNQFLSLRQQVQSLMIKRDQLKRQLKEKEDFIAEQKHKNALLEQELNKIKKQQAQLDQKYQLVRQCTIQQLQNLILTQNFQQKPSKQIKKAQPVNIEANKPLKKIEDNTQIQKQYLKNILIRYIKAETSGAFDQALTLLQIIGTLLKLDNESAIALENYKSKRRQWWYIKY